MIRVFELFCKLNFINISEIDFFNQSMAKINVNDHMCSFCKTKHPNWSRHAVLRDYFTKSLTVERICEKYNISISTLYVWKDFFIRHKKIWLGLLKDSYTSPLQFKNLHGLWFTLF